MLYQREQHEPLTDAVWDEALVKDRIGAIVATADAEFEDRHLWAPVEEWDSGGGRAPLPLTTLYRGASGVVWGLSVLRQRGFAPTRLDLPELARRIWEIWDANPAPEQHEPPVRTRASLYDGDSGILVIAHGLTGDSDFADLLYARVCENASVETNDLFSGAPGTMIAARALLERTAEQRWREAWRESAEVLWQRRCEDGFWIYPPYGKAPGAAHGVGTNASVLLAGGDMVPAARHDEVLRGAASALASSAVREGPHANWPLVAGDNLEWNGTIRLQWCHGAGGVVASAADLLDQDLLLAGAGLVWEAGPANMEKGPGICHGTAGNGYALLRTFARTGDEQWLERARRFAMHALDQVERWRKVRGRGRQTLWTGDIGAALFAADCISVNPLMPIIDYV